MVGERGCRTQGDDEAREEARQGGADALQFHVSSPVGSMTGSFERLHHAASSGTGIVRSRRLLVSKGHVDLGSIRGAVLPGRRRRTRSQRGTGWIRVRRPSGRIVRARSDEPTPRNPPREAKRHGLAVHHQSSSQVDQRSRSLQPGRMGTESGGNEMTALHPLCQHR